LSWLLNALKSSVGKKFIMGGTGLFLCFFLLVHLGGNLLLYVGPDVYNRYANALHANPAFLITSEVILYIAFFLHIFLAYVTVTENLAARKIAYGHPRQSKVPGRTLNVFGLTPDSTMAITGAIVLLFIIIHLTDFKFELWLDGEGMDPFSKANAILGNIPRKFIYFLGSLVLGVHVSHGAFSAFHSLGLNHPKYTPILRKGATVFGIIVAVGFGSFAAWGGRNLGLGVSPADKPGSATSHPVENSKTSPEEGKGG
jgi:succinate dehydrogenase / fumarate reductase cytochrome b subunit